MSTTRKRDPAGLANYLRVELDGGTADFDDVAHILQANAPKARIEQLRRHEVMRVVANELAARYKEGGEKADMRLLNDLAAAEWRALYLDVAPQRTIETRRRRELKRPRHSKMPKLDEWLDKQDLKLTNDKLWALLPNDSESEADVYRDGEQVCENRSHISSRSEQTITHHCGRGGFNRRVTAAIKRKKRR